MSWPSFIAMANDGVSTVHNWCKKVSGGGAFARIRLNAPHSGKRPPFSLIKSPAKRPGGVNPGSYGSSSPTKSSKTILNYVWVKVKVRVKIKARVKIRVNVKVRVEVKVIGQGLS